MAKSKTLEQVAHAVLDLYEAGEEAAYRDAGFDAGEFSGPACAWMVDHKVRELCATEGYDFEQVMCEVDRLTYQASVEAGLDPDAGRP